MTVRGVAIPFLVVLVLLLVALVLPSKRDTSVAAWWRRIRYQASFFARVALVIAVVAGFVWVVIDVTDWWVAPTR
jgi:hypothetical protein